jgi:hypothetical protein
MANDPPASAEAELIALEHARRAAITRGDFDAVESFLADTYYYAHINGLAERRDAYLSRCRADPGVISATSASDMSVQLRGDYALMTGRSRLETRMGVFETLFLGVWEHGAEGWKTSAYASTPLPTA